MLTTSEPVVSFEKVTKRYHFREGTTLKEFLPALIRRKQNNTFDALHEVSFDVHRGESLGIIGKNGSGKSTLLKIIAGVTVPSDGEVNVRGRVSPLIELGAGFHPDLTGRENLQLNSAILGMSRKELRDQWDGIVEFSGLGDFMDTPLKHYSSGMYVRLGFSLAVHSNPDILVLDEALAVGDLEFQNHCFERIRQFQRAGVTLILVSHGLDLISTFCTRAIELEHGKLLQDGNAQEVCDKYRESIGAAAEALATPT